MHTKFFTLQLKAVEKVLRRAETGITTQAADLSVYYNNTDAKIMGQSLDSGVFLSLALEILVPLSWLARTYLKEARLEYDTQILKIFETCAHFLRDYPDLLARTTARIADCTHPPNVLHEAALRAMKQGLKLAAKQFDGEDCGNLVGECATDIVKLPKSRYNTGMASASLESFYLGYSQPYDGPCWASALGFDRGVAQYAPCASTLEKLAIAKLNDQMPSLNARHPAGLNAFYDEIGDIAASVDNEDGDEHLLWLTTLSKHRADFIASQRKCPSTHRPGRAHKAYFYKRAP